MGDKEGPGNCDRSEETKETRKLNVIWDPGSDSGPSKRQERKNWGNLNKVCKLSNPIVPRLISLF